MARTLPQAGAERQAETNTSIVESDPDETDPEETEADSQPQIAEAAASAGSASDSDSTQLPSLKDDPTWLPSVEYFQAGQPFAIGDIDLSPFTIPTTQLTCRLCFQRRRVRMGFATDLGYISPNVKAQLQALDLLLLESNHDSRCCVTAHTHGP